ncbi:helix-turn-helix domain-containing protein [Staphylococcus aureus]
MGIGEGLKKLRKNKNMTMEQLATDLNNKYPDLMKLTKGKISKWENERKNLDYQLPKFWLSTSM